MLVSGLPSCLTSHSSFPRPLSYDSITISAISGISASHACCCNALPNSWTHPSHRTFPRPLRRIRTPFLIICALYSVNSMSGGESVRERSLTRGRRGMTVAGLVLEDHRPDVNPLGTPKDFLYPDRCAAHHGLRYGCPVPMTVMPPHSFVVLVAPSWFGLQSFLCNVYFLVFTLHKIPLVNNCPSVRFRFASHSTPPPPQRQYSVAVRLFFPPQCSAPL